mgnify:CR=1 FL=1
MLSIILNHFYKQPIKKDFKSEYFYFFFYFFGTPQYFRFLSIGYVFAWVIYRILFSTKRPLPLLLMSFRSKVRAPFIDFCTFLRKHARATRALLERRSIWQYISIQQTFLIQKNLTCSSECVAHESYMHLRKSTQAQPTNEPAACLD